MTHPSVAPAATPQVREALSAVEREIRALVAAHLGIDEALITRDAALVDDLGADSLDAVALILAIEDQFQIDIPDEEAEQIATVRQLVEYVTFATARATVPKPASTSEHRRGYVQPRG